MRQIGDKDQKIQNLEALLQKSKDTVSQLEAEREDLCAKIQAGEGETAVLNQLKEKNHALQEQVGTHTHTHTLLDCLTSCPLLLYRRKKNIASYRKTTIELLVIPRVYNFFSCVGFKGNAVDRQAQESIREQQASTR